MTYAAITGWGKCMPPAGPVQPGLSTFLETTDDWIVSRTGMKERRISHVGGIDLAAVAGARALACAGLAAEDLDLIVYGSCTYDEQVPNSASGVQVKLGAVNAASMDVNTACTSFLYGLSSANAMVRTGAVRNALVIGRRGDFALHGLDQSQRRRALRRRLRRRRAAGGRAAGRTASAKHTRAATPKRGISCACAAPAAVYTNRGAQLGNTLWDFDGGRSSRRRSRACRWRRRR